MKLVKANVSIPNEVAVKLSPTKIFNLTKNIQEYIEEAIVDLSCVQWDKDLKVTFE